jgi:hypothetical protein
VQVVNPRTDAGIAAPWPRDAEAASDASAATESIMVTATFKAGTPEKHSRVPRSQMVAPKKYAGTESRKRALQPMAEPGREGRGAGEKI